MALAAAITPPAAGAAHSMEPMGAPPLLSWGGDSPRCCCSPANLSPPNLSCRPRPPALWSRQEPRPPGWGYSYPNAAVDMSLPVLLEGAGVGRICSSGCSCSRPVCSCRPGPRAPRSKQEPGAHGNLAPSKLVRQELPWHRTWASLHCAPSWAQEGPSHTPVFASSGVSACTAWPLSAPGTGLDLGMGTWGP